MKIQFQADADFNVEVVLGLLRREPRIDFRTAEEANLRGVPDPEVLDLAAQEQRILVTHDPHHAWALCRLYLSPPKPGSAHHRAER